MKYFPSLLAVVLLLSGCSHEVPPPTPLPLEQLPAAFDAAFAKAQGSPKEMAAEVVSAVKAAEYPKAFAVLQTITSGSDLTAEQRTLLARAQLTLNGALQSAQSQGDTNAAQVLQEFRSSK